MNRAVQHAEVDPLVPVSWRPVTGRSATGAVTPRLGNPAVRVLETAGSAKWRFRPVGVMMYGTRKTPAGNQRGKRMGGYLLGSGIGLMASSASLALPNPYFA